MGCINLAYTDDVNLLEDNKDTNKTAETLIDASKEVSLKGNAYKTKYSLSHHMAGQSHNRRQWTDPLKMWHSWGIWEWQ
jgi:hypothetical protein